MSPGRQDFDDLFEEAYPSTPAERKRRARGEAIRAQTFLVLIAAFILVQCL